MKLNLFNKLNSAKLWFLSRSLIVKIVIIIFVGLVGWLLYSNTIQKKSSKPQYITAIVDKGSVISTVSESGNVNSSIVNVPSPTDGVIEEVYVKNGDIVVAGQNLFKVKSTATPQEQASAYASYLSAQNSLNAANAKLNSLQSALFKANQTFVNDKGVANPTTDDPKYIEERADWLQAESDYKNQSGVIAQTQAAFNSASLSYQATQNAIVVAPIGGTVANFAAQIGSGVSTSSNNSSSTTTTSSTPVLVIGDLSNLEVKVTVSEIDVSKIKDGQKATITLDAFPDKTFAGKVSSVDTYGTISSGVVSYTAYVDFVSPPSDIRSGMSASVIIQTDRHDDVIKIPTSAITTSNGASSVQIMKNGKVSNTDVETGITSDSETEITSGLSVGDTIVTSTVNPTISGATTTTTSPFSGLGGRGAGGFGGGGGNALIRRAN